MTTWARTRRALPVLLTLLAMVVIGAVLGVRSLLVPTLRGGAAQSLMLTTFLPLAWASVLADAAGVRRHLIEARPARRVAILDVLAFAGVVLVAATAFAVVVVATGEPLAGAGPVLVISGVAVTMTLRGGPGTGVLVCSVLLLGTAVYGPAAPAARYVRVLEADGDALWSVLCGVVLCVSAMRGLLDDRVR